MWNKKKTTAGTPFREMKVFENENKRILTLSSQTVLREKNDVHYSPL